MNEDDIDSAYVYYNEVALREIVVTFNLVFPTTTSPANTCVINSAITISSTIATKIKSLQSFKAILTSNLNSPMTNLQLANVLTFDGFDHVEIAYLQVTSTTPQDYYGITVTATTLKEFKLDNVLFTRSKQRDNNIQ